MDLLDGSVAPRPSLQKALALAFALAVGVGAEAAAQPTAPPDDPPPVERSSSGFPLPPGVEIQIEGTVRTAPNGDVTIDGPLTITSKGARIQADTALLREQRFVEASGNVLIAWEGNRLFGSKLEYDLETERGVVYDAMASVLDQYVIWARLAEKIGERKLRITDATVTTCTQPLPYWSFRVSRATITIDQYARMTNVRLRAAKMPVIYLPYMVWPVKDGRAAGLLLPELSSTDSRGYLWSQELFVPLGPSADVTLLGRYYTEAGFGGGAEARFIPGQNGSGRVDAFYIDDDVFARTNDGDGRRYAATYQQDQSFSNGFRMVADMNFISDPQYYSDYERDLNIASSPDTKARFELSRNGKWTSLNVREFRREQLSTGLVQTTLPEIEWRGRSTKLGPTPLYLSFASSITNIRQEGAALEADYWRGDASPELSLPYSPFAWLDITPRVAYRWTRWTEQRQDIAGVPAVVEQDLSRGLWSYGLELVGPKIYRIFRTGADARSSFKHSIETRVRYGFAEAFDRQDDVIVYDEVDSVRGSDRQVTYSLVQRLFVKRPRAKPEPAPGSEEERAGADGGTAPAAAAAPKAEDAPEPPHEPVEIASLQLTQSRSFDRELLTRDTDGDGVPETSPFGPLALTGRYNPSAYTSLDVGASWDVLFNNLANASLSGSWRNRSTLLRLSLFHSEGLGLDSASQPLEDDTQVRYYTGFSFLREPTLNTDKLQFSVSGSYVANPVEGLSNFPDQRWTLRYGTQCCTFYVERLTRDIDDRRELHLRIDLSGVGKILSSTF